MAACSIALSAVPLLASWWWVFDLFTHFRVQLIAAQLGLVALCAIARRPAWCAVLGLSAMLNAYSIGDYLLPRGLGPAAHAAGPSITLMSANIRGSRRLDRLLITIERESPDVIVIQEYLFRSQGLATALAARYPYRFEVLRPDFWGIALFSRFPLRETEEFALGRTSAIDTRITVENIPLRMFGVHLSSPTSAEDAAARGTELAELARRARSVNGPLVVVGDFNVSPYSPHFGRFVEQTGLRDSLAGRGPRITWPTFLPMMGIPIDHCLISREWQIVDYRRLPDFGSDHYPIVIELQYQASA